MNDSQPSFLDAGLSRLGRLIGARPTAILAVLILSLLPAGWLAAQLEVKASFLDLLPEQEAPVRELREVLNHARSSSDIAIAISAKDRPLAERFAAALTEEIAKQPGVAGVGGHIDLAWFKDRRLLFVPEDELEALVRRTEEAIDHELLKRTGLYVDLEEGDDAPEDAGALLGEVHASEEKIGRREWVITRDGRYLCLWVFFRGNSGDLAFGREALAKTKRVVETVRDRGGFPRDLELHYAGGLPSRVEDEAAFVADLSVAGPIGFIAVVLLISLTLRSPRALVLIALPLLIGLVWTFAFARLAIGHLNIISGFLFSILSGLGIEYGIHLIHRYRELREEGVALEPAIEQLVSKTGRALLSGAVTNAGVFAVIAAARFRGFSEFGFIAAVGLMLTLVATVLALPALLVWTERRWPRPVGPAREEHARPVHVPRAARWTVLVLVPAFALFSAGLIGQGRVQFDGNWRLLAGGSEATRFGEYLRHHLEGLFTGAILWIADDADLPRVVGAIDAARSERKKHGKSDAIAEIAALHTAFPSAESQARRTALAQGLGEQLRRIDPESLNSTDRARLEDGLRVVAATRPVPSSELPEVVVGPFLTRDGRGSIVHLRMRETDDPSTDVLVAWADEAREIKASLARAGIDAPMLSENWIAGEIFERVARDGRFLLIGTLVAVFLVLLLDFRRPLLALAVLGSVLLGVLGIAGGMWLTGVQLNFMNAAILPVCVGISLDNAIHVYHRWKEGGPGSVPMVLRHTTAANALASSTNLLGFAALALTHHAGLRSVAYLAMIGVTATYLSTTVWFPMVLETVDAWRLRKSRT